MRIWLEEFIKQLTGYYSHRTIDCKSYNVINYLKQTNYKGDFYERKKVLRRRSSASQPAQGNQ